MLWTVIEGTRAEVPTLVCDMHVALPCRYLKRRREVGGRREAENEKEEGLEERIGYNSPTVRTIEYNFARVNDIPIHATENDIPWQISCLKR